MDHSNEPSTGIDFDDTAFVEAIEQASQEIAPVAEADHDFYKRVLDACTAGIGVIDKQIADIKAQAERLFESQTKLTTDRQRLATQRNAARISLRYLEDSEARRQASGG